MGRDPLGFSRGPFWIRAPMGSMAGRSTVLCMELQVSTTLERAGSASRRWSSVGLCRCWNQPDAPAERRPAPVDIRDPGEARSQALPDTWRRDGQMNSGEPRRPAPEVGFRDFPHIGERMRVAYADLWLAGAIRDEQQAQGVGLADDLSRPWDPATCRDPQLRREVWQWLDQVVDWINAEYAWSLDGLIPECWYLHPHLVHELGVVADQRRRAGSAYTSDDLGEWQRYCLPSFLDRMRSRIGSHCEYQHKDQPGRARLLRYNSSESLLARQAWYETEAREITSLQVRVPED